MFSGLGLHSAISRGYFNQHDDASLGTSQHKNFVGLTLQIGFEWRTGLRREVILISVFTRFTRGRESRLGFEVFSKVGLGYAILISRNGLLNSLMNGGSS
jgi:hypothetical protein